MIMLKALILFQSLGSIGWLMEESSEKPDPGWYQAKGDPVNSQRYWNGDSWEGNPKRISNDSESGVDLNELPEPYDRMAARFIDWCVWVAIFLSVKYVGEFTFTSVKDNELRNFVLSSLGILFIALYEAISNIRSEATYGKRFMKIKVINAEPESKLNVQTAIKRVVPVSVVAVLISAIGLLFPAISALLFSGFTIGMGAYGAYSMFNDSKAQTLWDHFAKTLVVKK